MPQSLRHLSPLRVVIGSEDVTHYLGDGWTFSNVDPGGFEACSLPFPRDMAQTLRGQYIRIDSGLGVAWEGRVSQIQRSLGHNTTVMGEGYAALFKDAAGSMVFVDRDFTRWQGSSVQRQINLLGASVDVTGPQIAADTTTGAPSVETFLTGAWAREAISEAWYDSGAENLIGSVYYAWKIASSVNSADSNWGWAVILAADDVASSFQSSGSLRAAGPGTGTLTASASYRFAIFQQAYTVAAGAANALYPIYWQPAVYGNHGLTGRGSSPVGFYPSDIFGWAVGQASGLQAGVVQTTDASNFIVPHYVQYIPVTLDTIVGDMGTIQGWHWGVWESLSPLTGSALPRADFRPRPAPRAFTAFCRRSDCDTLDIREDLSQQFNQAAVNYTDAAGVSQSVVVTADNPILDEAGIPTKTVVFQGGTMTSATASLFGAEALQITNAQARVAGTADIISPIDGGARPAWLLRAGIDRLRILDVPSTDAWGSMNDYPITRVEASISSSGFNTSVEIGSGANLIETLQSRLASATALAGQGGG